MYTLYLVYLICFYLNILRTTITKLGTLYSLNLQWNSKIYQIREGPNKAVNRNMTFKLETSFSEGTIQKPNTEIK